MRDMETSSATATAHKPWQSVDGDDAPKRGSLTPTLYGMRRSCEPCRRRKKKCDGGQPCRRCLGRENGCTYSKRSWHMPHPQQRQQSQQQHDPSREHQDLQKQSTSGAVLGHGGTLSFKRCRLSASPATGLVGMQENAFLGDYFGCIGFLPLTTQSHIRETMVKIMVTPASRQHSAFGGGADSDPVGRLDAIVRNAEFGGPLGGGELPMGPSTCVFWCAVALGALVRGNPIESVASYTQLATEALAKTSGPVDAEIAKAWAILAYVYGFMGDLATFQEYMALSGSFLTSSIEQGLDETLPVGFTEILQRREIGVRNAFEELDSNGELLSASVSARERIHPKLKGAATEPELYQYVMQSFRAFEQAVFSKVVDENAAACRKRPPEEAKLAGGGDGDGENPSRKATTPDPQEIADAMVSVMQKDVVFPFSILQEAVDRPSIRAGVGGLLINGALVFEVACTGDVPNTLKRIHRCVEVLVRYPGLCRSMVGLHFAHTMLGALAALDDPGAVEVYDRLRAVYNVSRPGGTSPAPPMEEWQEMSMICENLQCRATERLIASDRMSAFSKPPGGVAPDENGGGGAMGEQVFGLAGQSQSGHLTAASIVPEQEAFVPATCSPGGSEAGGDLYSTCDTGGGGLASDGKTERCMGSTARATAQAASNKTRVEAAVSGEGPIGELEDDELAAADWLDVSCALLEEVNKSDQACR